MEQEEFCFDVGLDDSGVSLLINSKEQMLTEKLRSILKFGSFSTRYKDVYDIYYLFPLCEREKLLFCFTRLIFDDLEMRENSMRDIVKRVENTFRNKRYLERLRVSKKNWVGVETEMVLEKIMRYLEMHLEHEMK